MPVNPPRRCLIVITGVTRGLGRALVDEFVRAGCFVHGCARTKDQIHLLRGVYPDHSFAIVDVRSNQQVRTWIKELVAKCGPPDLVLNNAAVFGGKAPVWRIGDKRFREEIETNIVGTVNIIRHVAPAMIARRRGIIVNFTSRWGRRYEAGMGPYCATKSAVVALTKVLSCEFQEAGVAAVALNPGVVRTKMLRRYFGFAYRDKNDEYVSAAAWAKAAVPRLLRLRCCDNGRLLTIAVRQQRSSFGTSSKK